jgi:hypothetical protein
LSTPSRSGTKASPSPVTTFSKRIARGLARRMRDFADVQPEGFELDDIPSAQVALYFPDGVPKLYQLTQWLPVFEASTDMVTIVVVRQIETYQALVGSTSLRVLLVPRYEDLMALYDRADFHAVIYVNNGWTNFQSLSFQQAVHIHVNHGESDKICMVSNQAKAYDRVFVAGEAAVRRHAAAIAWFDTSRLVRVGRPQLDLDIASPLPECAGPTITYAPTWEGEDDANNYTSVDLFGPAIIAAALAQPGSRVVYKPHPRVADSSDAGVKSGHQQIVAMLTKARQLDPSRGHAVLLNTDVLGVIRATDLLVADVSSVTLDHLYLRPDAPIMLTDRRSDRAQLTRDAPVAAAVPVVDNTSIGTLAASMEVLLTDDTLRTERRAMRTLYFGSLEPGQSTEHFWNEINLAIAQHDSALSELSRIRIVTTGEST